MKTLIIFCMLITIKSLAQAEEAQLIDIDLTSFCKDLKESNESEAVDFSQKNTCDKIKELQAASVAPITLNKMDDDGNLWKIRFSFGFSRTHYYPTDINIKSSIINVVVKNVQMYERTSADYYNPATWKTFQNGFQWIDEPTNTFTLSLEKKNDVFYLTVFHPKYLKSLVYMKTDVNGQDHYDFQSIDEKGDQASQIPAGHELLYLGNTYHDIIWQIGYGHKFEIFNSQKAGKLSYTIRGDAGINTGHARSFHIGADGVTTEFNERDKFQGLNASLGHRLEYQRGRVSLFVDQKTIFSKVEHGFLDGTASYNLVETPTTFGIGIDLFSKKRRH